MTKQEIIKETAEFYNLANRGTNVNMACSYLTDDGRCCAVGRCIIPEKLQDFTTDSENGPVSQIGSYYLNDNLMEQYRGHTLEFWSVLQRFHDREANWDGDGMTEYGHRVYEDLLVQHAE